MLWYVLAALRNLNFSCETIHSTSIKYRFSISIDFTLEIRSLMNFLLDGNSIKNSINKKLSTQTSNPYSETGFSLSDLKTELCNWICTFTVFILSVSYPETSCYK